MIAEAWDTSYVLYDGVPDAAEIARLRANVPRQEAGRFTERELVLSRANKSVRLFDSVAPHAGRGRAAGRGGDRARRLSDAHDGGLRQRQVRPRRPRRDRRPAGIRRARSRRRC